MNEFTMIEIGKPFPALTVGKKEGNYLALRPDGFHLFVTVASPTKDEIEDVLHGRIEFGFIIEGPRIYLLFKFGNQLWNETAFCLGLEDPTDRTLPEDIPANLGFFCNIYLLDAPDRIVRAMRIVTLPHNFSFKLLETLKAQRGGEINRLDNQMAVDAMYERFPETYQMVPYCSALCSISSNRT